MATQFWWEWQANPPNQISAHKMNHAHGWINTNNWTHKLRSAYMSCGTRLLARNSMRGALRQLPKGKESVKDNPPINPANQECGPGYGKAKQQLTQEGPKLKQPWSPICTPANTQPQTAETEPWPTNGQNHPTNHNGNNPTQLRPNNG